MKVLHYHQREARHRLGQEVCRFSAVAVDHHHHNTERHLLILIRPRENWHRRPEEQRRYEEVVVQHHQGAVFLQVVEWHRLAEGHQQVNTLFFLNAELLLQELEEEEYLRLEALRQVVADHLLILLNAVRLPQ